MSPSAVELRDLDVRELQDKVRELREQLFNLRFQRATGQLDNHRRMRFVRRELARVRTVIREFELEQASQARAAAAAPAATEEAPE